MNIELTALDKILAAYRNNERDFVTYQELAALLRSAAVKVSANPAENEQLARDAQAIVDADVKALGQARRAKKIGGSYQAEGTIVSTFATLAGETRHVFEFDQPAGMLHIFGPGQVEIAAAPQVVADEPTGAQMDKWYESASSAHQSLRADRYAFGRACYRAGMEAKKNES